MEISTQSAAAFLESIADEQRRQDSKQLAEIMQAATGATPALWGTSIIGFGSHHYKYDSGREGDTMIVGFSPRAQALVLYGLAVNDANAELVQTLGKYKPGKGCLYIKNLADVDEAVLRQMIVTAYRLKAA